MLCSALRDQAVPVSSAHCLGRLGAKGTPVQIPELPGWACPDHERTSGGAQLVQPLDDLRTDMPVDIDLQRNVYRHLHDALKLLRPPAQEAVMPPPNAILSPTA